MDRSTELWQASDAELLAGLGALQTELNTTWARMLGFVREVQDRGLAERRGYGGVADLLREAQNVTRSTAAARVRAARDVLAARGVSGAVRAAGLPVTAQAVAEGAVSAEHVRAIQDTLAGLPAHLEGHRAGLEAELAGFARALDLDAVRRLGGAALARLDPDGPRPRDGDPTRTRFALVPRGAGFDAHHILHWADGGVTALHNLVLLCPRHHTLIHSGEWAVSLGQGFPIFHPPPWIPGGPRRNPLHRTDLIARA
ncbi:HNH endonuclease signature motif containing protein [Pseudonocardia acidicola]|uniref:HNH endonuclease signature motif containing protein n=1 Tax=Pseudonocardia acidicola TaxID=2724939 RepID=UPI001B7CE1FA